MDRYLGGQFPYAAFFWPALVAASAAETASSIAAQFMEFSGDAGDPTQEPEGATPSKIALELHAVRLRDFTMVKNGVPTLLCTPLALHGAAVADLAAGHSLVAALRGAGIERLFMADWRSASADMRFLGIDEYLADLNVLVDCVGGLVDLIGLCQGGCPWSMPDDSQPRYASLLWPERRLILLRGNPDCRLSPRRLP
jgi:poly(3-hydroxybutyrate) depolymerase